MGKINNSATAFSFGFNYRNVLRKLSEITFPRPHISQFSEGAYLQTLLVWSTFGAQYVLHVRTLFKAIATRLKKILAQIIHPCQAGYIKGRHMGECIRMISDIMSFTKQKNVPGAAVFLDSEKAFDSIE